MDQKDAALGTDSRENQLGILPENPMTVGVKTIYVCGPTIYRRPHLGNYRVYVFADVLARVLGCSLHIGLTDISDQIVESNRVNGPTPTQNLRAEYTEDLASLGVTDYTIHPVTDNIAEIVSTITWLKRDGFTVETEKDWRFRVGTKVHFALWKKEKGPLTYESPYGRGRPGWHIECVSNVLKLRQPVLHGGGLDLKPYHHHYEEALFKALGRKVSWFHCHLLTLNGQKMSKSTGNVVFPEGVPVPCLARYFLLTADFDKTLDYSVTRFEQRVKELERMVSTIYRVGIPPLPAGGPLSGIPLYQTGAHLRLLYGATSDTASFVKTFLYYNRCYKLVAINPDRVTRVLLMAAQYNTVKLSKDYEKADAIRSELIEYGIHMIKDTSTYIYKPFFKFDKQRSSK